MSFRGVAAGAIAAGLMVSLSGCGSDAGSGTGTGGGAAAASLTSANFSRTVTTAQQASKSAHFEASVNAAGQTISMSGDVSGFKDVGSAAMDMKIKAMGKRFEIRLVHKVLYLHGTGMPMMSGKPWLKSDLTDPRNPLSKILETAGPRSMAMYLQAVKNLRDRGVGTVDGVQAHHYTVTIDTAKALAANPLLKGQDLSKLGMPKTLTTDAWVDAKNRPIKMTVAIGKLATVTVHVSKYGEPVSVHAPPANEVGVFHLGH
jgi:hypothetical protein